MGWCHEFGPQIAESCEHPMTAHPDRCECSVCGTVCTGRFAGCGAVWARGPREVAVNAPRIGQPSSIGEKDDLERWRLPLEAPTATDAVSSFGETAAPVAIVSEMIEARVRYGEVQFDRLSESVGGLKASTARTEAALEKVHGELQRLVEETPAVEAPDVTARYAVAQLEELNARVAGLTEDTTARAEAALEKVYGELRRLGSMREVDLTEQAAGIFGAVQAGSDALEAFTKTVAEVTDDLRTILADALKSIGGTDGLAAWVAASASDLAETREELATSLGRIERDITLLRRRSQADAKPSKIDDDQVAFIVDAVTEAVLATLDPQGRRRK